MRTHQFIAGLCSSVLILSALAVAQSQPPEVKPGQAVSVREGDTWSSATLQKKEGRKYLIRYDDGKEEWVTADRVRVDGAAGGTTGGAGGAPATSDKPAKAPAAGPAVSLEGPFTQVVLQQTKGVDKRANAPVVVKPATRPSEPFTDLTPAAGGLGNVDEVVICPDTPNIVIAIGGRQGDDTPLMRIDINNPSATEMRVLTAKDHRVMAAADGGNTVITQPTTWGSQTMSLWEYNDGKYDLKANYAFIANGENRRPDWARLLTPTRLLMRSGFGETYLVDLRAKRQLGYLQCGDLTVHSSGQYIVTQKGNAGLILRASDLSIVAEIPKSQSSFSLDASGTHVVSGEANTITVTKLANKSQVAQISGGINDRGSFNLLDPTSLLVDGKTYYDLKTGIPVWSYKMPNGKSVMLSNGQLLFVTSDRGHATICMAGLPDAAAVDALKNASPDQFVISPGAKIAVAGDLNAIGNAAEARKNLERSITAAGHKLDDSATQFKLTLTTAAGPTGKFSVQEFNMRGPPAIREVDAPSTIITVVLTKDGETIWQRELKFSAQVMIMRRKDQSLEDAVAEAGKPNPGRLGALDFPGYIVKGSKPHGVVTLGESALTNTGFVASPPPGAK